jgi:dTDP-4-amino-4,6-dideoxygalactose transaminase
VPKVRLPNAKLLGETTLMFLIHPTLTSAEMDEMCNVIDGVFLEAKNTKVS